MKSSSIKSLTKLWSELKKVHKYLFISVCMSSIIVAILESLVIFSFIPFITSLSAENSDNNNQVIPDFLNFFQFSQDASNAKSFLIFIFIIFLSAFCRLIYIYLTTRTSAIIGSYLSKKTYNILLHQPYLEQVSNDTGYVIQTAQTTANLTVLNEWNHIVLSRASGTVSLYLNGTRLGTASNTANINFSGLSIGAYMHDGNYEANGTFSNFRFV